MTVRVLVQTYLSVEIDDKFQKLREAFEDFDKPWDSALGEELETTITNTVGIRSSDALGDAIDIPGVPYWTGVYDESDKPLWES